MTTYGTTANVIGMYTEKYEDYFIERCNVSDNERSQGVRWAFQHIDVEKEKHILVARSDSGNYLTFTLSCYMGVHLSGSPILKYGSLDIEIVNSDVIEKITHFPIDSQYTDFSVDLERIKNSTDIIGCITHYECNVFSISGNGDNPCYPWGGYSVNENLFVDFDIRKAKKEFIDTISEELLSIVWSSYADSPNFITT